MPHPDIRRILVALLLVITAFTAIVLIGAKGIGKKIGAPGVDKIVSRGLERLGISGAPDSTPTWNIGEIAGTWSGVSDVDGTAWKFTFEDNHAVRVSSSSGYSFDGTAFIHWDLGQIEGNIRVPAGWSVLDIDTINSSEPSHRNKVSLGAYSLRKDVLKYCFSEPGKLVRPITDLSGEEIRCFNLTKEVTGAAGSRPTPAAVTKKNLPSPAPSAAPLASADDLRPRVTNFHATVSVQDNGTLNIKETIRVDASGGTVKRTKSPFLNGIYRTIGGRIQGRHAYYRLKGFKVKGATLDGNPIPWSDETSGKWFVRYVFLGPETLYLSSGKHEFTLEYETDRHVTFLPDHDEIFWWVFGFARDGWGAESSCTAAVTFVLPFGSHGIIANLEDHSWNKGTGKVPGLLNSAARSENSNVLHYSMVLSEKKSYLSVVVSMPKGTVREPDFDTRVLYFLRDMTPYVPGLIGLTVFFAYYLIVWARVGRDPRGKSIVPRYRPPEDCSPAAARRLVIMGYDRTAFASALLDLAAKGAMKITRMGDRYFVEKTGDVKGGIPPDEQVLHNALFDRKYKGRGPERKELDALTIHHAYRKHRKYLRSIIDKRFFVRNYIYLIPGILLSLGVAAINFAIVDMEGSYVKELAALGLWIVLAGFITRFFSRKKVFELRKPSKLVYLLTLFPAVLYSLAVALSHSLEIFNIMQFMFLVPLCIMVTAHFVFFFLLRAPTVPGKKALDEIEGFRTYLAAAEGDRLDRMTPPEKTPALFQAYLPYALALGVENRWSENFSGQIDETYTLPPLDVFLSALSKLRI